MSRMESEASGCAAGLAPEAAAAYALAVHGIRLTGKEAEWFAAEMLRGAGAVQRASAGMALFDVQMAAFDALLRGEGPTP